MLIEFPVLFLPTLWIIILTHRHHVTTSRSFFVFLKKIFQYDIFWEGNAWQGKKIQAVSKIKQFKVISNI